MFDPVALLDLCIEAFAKDAALCRAFAALVVRHVFDKGDRWNLEVVEHLDAFDNVDVR